MDRPPRPTERAAGVLRRVLEIAARILRGLTILAVAAAGSVATAWLAWVVDAPPKDTDEWIGRVIVLGILLTAPAVLLLFLAGLRELRERARALPADIRTRATELDARSRRRAEPGGVRGLLLALFRLTRLVVSSRDVLSPYAAITAALRPAILLAALGATGAALLEVPASPIAILVMVLAA